MLAACCCSAKEEEANSIVQALPSHAADKAAREEETVTIKAQAAAQVADPPCPPEVPPAPPAREFIRESVDVELVKKPGETLGLELDPLDNQTMEICKINDGAVKSYNDGVRDRTKMLQNGDFIFAVNGAQGSTDKMIERVQQDSTLKISVRRLKTWEANLTQTPGSIRPCLNRAANGRTLLILDIDDKAFKQWNRAHPELDIKQDDRIFKVNGVSLESEKMMDKIENDAQLSLQLVRPTPQ